MRFSLHWLSSSSFLRWLGTKVPTRTAITIMTITITATTIMICRRGLDGNFTFTKSFADCSSAIRSSPCDRTSLLGSNGMISLTVYLDDILKWLQWELKLSYYVVNARQCRLVGNSLKYDKGRKWGSKNHLPIKIIWLVFFFLWNVKQNLFSFKRRWGIVNQWLQTTRSKKLKTNCPLTAIS